jgi:hypothetical protein
VSGADSLRGWLRRRAPGGARRLVEALRAAVGQLPVDDVVLADYRFAPEAGGEGGRGARLNLVIPNISPGVMFGGVTTGAEIAIALAQAIGADALRLIVTDPEHDTDPALIARTAAAMGWPADKVGALVLRSARQSIPARRDDVFIAYNFWTALNIGPVIAAQAAHYRAPELPLLYLIQDYEPQMFAFSSGHMLAREAYDTPPRLWGVFNSGSLAAYFRLMGHEAERCFAFEPVIGDALRPLLGEVAAAQRARRIVVYGRPAVERNCFPALVRGLRRWAADYPEFADWEVVSAGTPHKPVALGDGREMRSVGKLALDDYAQLLLGSRVGVSLMASPHPSYPPLEMAHMGLLTVTNRYTCKDLAGWHGNIVSTGSIAEAPLAAAIAEACRRSAEPPAATPNADFVRAAKYPFMAELAGALKRELELER